MTALHLAAEGGHIKIVTHLCDKEADLNIQDNDGVNLNAGRLADWVWISHFKESAQLMYENNSLSAFKLIVASCM